MTGLWGLGRLWAVQGWAAWLRPLAEHHFGLRRCGWCLRGCQMVPSARSSCLWWRLWGWIPIRVDTALLSCSGLRLVFVWLGDCECECSIVDVDLDCVADVLLGTWHVSHDLELYALATKDHLDILIISAAAWWDQSSSVQ